MSVCTCKWAGRGMSKQQQGSEMAGSSVNAAWWIILFDRKTCRLCTPFSSSVSTYIYLHMQMYMYMLQLCWPLAGVGKIVPVIHLHMGPGATSNEWDTRRTMVKHGQTRLAPLNITNWWGLTCLVNHSISMGNHSKCLTIGRHTESWLLMINRWLMMLIEHGP